MKDKLISLILLLGFAVALAIPAAPAAAAGAVKTPYSGFELGVFCSDPDWAAYCSPGELTVLPNGKAIVRNMGLVIGFDTSDPRFTGMAVVTFNFQPGSAQVTPINGRIIFYPASIDGYWEGVVSITITPNGWHSQYEAKGYGALAGMIIYGVNRSGSIFGMIIKKP